MSCDNSVDRSTRGRTDPAPPRTLVIGLGNPILGDDGVGWRVAETVSASLPANNGCGRHVEVDCYALGGLSLMERLIGYERAIIADAIQTSDGKPGNIYCLSLDDLPDLSAGHTTAAHDTSLQTAIRLGRAMGAMLPDEISLVAVEARRVYDFSEELSPAVAAAVPRAAQIIMRLLQTDRTPVTKMRE